MAKQDMLYISQYNDFYGVLLTQHQSEMIRLYYDCDISLFEIAEQFGISRQAVRESIKRAETQLKGYEQALGMVERHNKLKTLALDILSENESGNCKSVNDKTRELLAVLEENNGSVQQFK